MSNRTAVSGTSSKESDNRLENEPLKSTVEHTIPSITQTMNVLASMGMHVMVRVDPERDVNRYTIVINNVRLCDTDAPDRDLYMYFHKNLAGALRSYLRKAE